MFLVGDEQYSIAPKPYKFPILGWGYRASHAGGHQIFCKHPNMTDKCNCHRKGTGPGCYNAEDLPLE
jgi:hypothetical protein